MTRSPAPAPRHGIVQLEDSMAWYNNSSLRPPQPQLVQPRAASTASAAATVGTGGGLLSPPRAQKIQQQSGGLDNDVGGPIYEDIDRMCSYRGYPPGWFPFTPFSYIYPKFLGHNDNIFFSVQP